MKLFTITLALLSVSTSAFAVTSWNSVYTDMKSDCVTISASTDKAPIDFFTSDCKAYAGYRLQETGGDIRYHPQLSFNGVDIPMGTPGAFHDMGSTKVEWMYSLTQDEEGIGQINWAGFIYRLNVDYADETHSNKLYVVRLAGEKSCFIGTTNSNEEARKMVKNTSLPCKDQDE